MSGDRLRCRYDRSVHDVRLTAAGVSACARCRAERGLRPADSPEQLAATRAAVTGETVEQALAVLRGEPSPGPETPPRPDPDRPAVPPGRLHLL